MNKQPRVQFASRTDVGMRRAANQDSLATRLCDAFEEWQSHGHLFVVADGMGGHAVGDLASRITVDTLPHVFFKTDAQDALDRMARSVLAANKAVNDRGRENPDFADMGTTCSVLSLSEAGAVVGHIGDSRVYRIRDGIVSQLTFDHSLQWEMIRLGRATADNVDLYHPRNVITRCLGPDPNVAVDLEGPFSVQAGDRFVLCSDGLTNHVTDSEMGSIVTSLPPADASRLLINLTNCRGGSDNTSVIVVEIEEYPALPNAPVDRDSVKPQERETTGGTDSDLTTIRRISAACAAILMIASGMLALQQFWGWAIASGISGVALGIVAGLLSKRAQSESAASQVAGNADDADDDPLSGSTHYAKSPYRVLGVAPAEKLLNLLAEVQSELVHAAQDSGWNVDFEELKSLTRQATQSHKSKNDNAAIRLRARAIDILMKELYHRSRKTVPG